MSEYLPEEYALGFEDCRCEPYPDEGACVACGERVKYADHHHFKGGLFHLWCLLLSALRNAQPAISEVGSAPKAQ